MLSAFIAALEALAALPTILSDIKAAIASLEGAVAASQQAKFQAALADYQQKTVGAKTVEDFKNASMALHNTLGSL